MMICERTAHGDENTFVLDNQTTDVGGDGDGIVLFYDDDDNVDAVVSLALIAPRISK